jgi:mRNA interferase MazF
MTIKRGEIWLAELNPIRGSEQAGTRPVLILQNNSINRFTSTFLAIPICGELRYPPVSSCQKAKADWLEIQWHCVIN